MTLKWSIFSSSAFSNEVSHPEGAEGVEQYKVRDIHLILNDYRELWQKGKLCDESSL